MVNVLKIFQIIFFLTLYSCNKSSNTYCLDCLSFPTSVLIDLNITDSLNLSIADKIYEGETYYHELRYGHIGRIQDRFRIENDKGVIITSKSKRKKLPAEHQYMKINGRSEIDLSEYYDSAAFINQDSVCFSACMSYAYMYSYTKSGRKCFTWDLWVDVAGYKNMIEVCSYDSSMVCKYRDYILEYGKFVEDPGN